MSAPPKWAQDLTLKALLWWEEQGNQAPLFNLSWRHGSGFRSSGTSWTIGVRRLVITAGRDRQDQKLVLLHEIAHQLAPAKDHHSDTFWDIAWMLYRWAKLPIRYCLNRERHYRVGAMASYRRNKP